jgi:hypothetical protein
VVSTLLPVQFVIRNLIKGKILKHINVYIVVSSLMPVQFVISPSVKSGILSVIEGNIRAEFKHFFEVCN